ncbi:hypothetical protein D3C87_1404100 [compost metagenome]
MMAHMTSRRSENIGASPTTEVKAYQPKIAAISRRGVKTMEKDRSFTMNTMKLKSRMIAVSWFNRLDPSAIAEP